MAGPDSLKCSCAETNGGATDPDCVRCLRKKVSALGVVVFFEDGGQWRIGNFESDSPREDAEVSFHSMLRSGLPTLVAGCEKGILFRGDADLRAQVPALAGLLSGCSVIGAPVRVGEKHGVRVAWREQREPFSAEDLNTLQCFSRCPDGCGTGCCA